MNLLRVSFRALLIGLALSTALSPSPAAAQPVPVTPRFQVNTYTDGDQVWPVVAANDSGRFVVVWHSSWLYEPRQTQDGEGFGIFGQVFDASGERIGTEFQVNQTTTGNQDMPDVKMAADGRFVIVWRSETPGSFDSRIFGRRFDPTGAPLGDEFVVSDATLPERDFYPAVALDEEGRFVVAWQRIQNGAPPTLTDSVHARRFDASGAPLGPSFRVSGDQAGGWPSVVLDAAGGFLVFYQGTGLLVQRYTADGEPVGEAVQLEVPARFGAQFPEAAGRPETGSVAVWQSGLDIFGRRLDPAGNPQGLAFPVSTTSAGDSLVFQQVAVDPAGGFTVLWVKDNVDENGLFIQRFDATGARQGVETRIDTGPWPVYLGAVATVNANGDFVAAWTSGRHHQLDGPDGSGFAIFARIFRLPPLGADACLAAGGHLACDTLRDGGNSDLDLEITAQPGDVPLAGNLDGDVRDDLCLYRDGRFLCDLAHDGGTPEVTIAFGGAAVDVPLLGDVNGDGKDDACLRRRRRFLCDTAHNGGTAEVQILFGRPRDVPLLGDVDGDGDDEPCVFRAGRFSCDTAHDGRTAEVAVAFGSAGDVPLLGDVDHDGDDDFCVFTGSRFLCDTAHDGGAAEIEIPFAGSAGTVPVLGNLDGF